MIETSNYKTVIICVWIMNQELDLLLFEARNGFAPFCALGFPQHFNFAGYFSKKKKKDFVAF